MAETELDAWQPEGEPIHPYDLYDLLNETDQSAIEIDHPPASKDEADYMRNSHKLGTVVEVGGRRYHETTSVPYKSTTFKEGLSWQKR